MVVLIHGTIQCLKQPFDMESCAKDDAKHSNAKLMSTDFAIHVASWPALNKRVHELHAQVQAQNSDVKITPLTTHLLPHLSMVDSWQSHFHQQRISLSHVPASKSMTRFSELIPQMLVPWDAEEHIDIYRACMDIASSVNPAWIVLDPFVSPAHDMARTEKWADKHCVMNPMSLGGHVAMQQPWLKGWWQYPAACTAFSYPLQLTQIPRSIYCTLSSIYCFLTDPWIAAVNAARAKEGFITTMPTFTPLVPTVVHISPSLPELDYPMTYPTNVLNCGPILLPAEPVEKVDPELFAWYQFFHKNIPILL